VSETTVFLFTDVEGSTRLWETYPADMPEALALHDSLLRNAVESFDGAVFKHLGDGMAAVFASVHAAVSAALQAQLALLSAPWPPGCQLNVRMGVHAGSVTRRDDDYFGPTVNRAARVMSAGHGRQIIVTDDAMNLIGPMAASTQITPLGRHHLRDLAEPIALFQVHAAGLPHEFPKLRTLDAYPSNLSRNLGTFFGRADDFTAIGRDLRSAVAVSIVGPAGMGKTRLAKQLAADALPRFESGVWFVDLSTSRTGDEVLAAVLSVLELKHRITGHWLEDLAARTAERPLLLVLDNCEQAQGPVADLVELILGGCPGVRVLSTSQVPLGVTGEIVHRVDGLPTAVAVELFVERATTARGSRRVDPDDPAIGELCARLDGVPLAIELAAARARVLAPAEILARLHERFRLLSGSDRRVERHQTLKTALDWSYSLCSEQERALLDRLGVFVGGFDLVAVETVCADVDDDKWEVLDLLEHLVDRSFVVADTSAGQARYRLLEMVRDYAIESLARRGELDRMWERHARGYLERVRLFGQYLHVPPADDNGQTWSDIRFHFENIRAAMAWFAKHGAHSERAEILLSLGLYWLTESPLEEARECLDVLRFADSLAPRLRVDLTVEAAEASSQNGDFRLADALLNEARSVSEANQFGWPTRLVLLLATIAEMDGRSSDVITHCEELLPQVQDDLFFCVVVRLRMTGAVADLRAADAPKFAAETLLLADRTGVPLISAAARLVQGLAIIQAGGPAADAAESFTYALETGAAFMNVAIPARLGLALVEIDANPVNALRLIASSFSGYVGVEAPVFVSACFDVAASACAALGRRVEARALFLGSAFIRRSCGFSGYKWVWPSREPVLRMLSDLRSVETDGPVSPIDELSVRRAEMIVSEVLSQYAAGN
jgi:predicted ATPase/class 3 adenylate cyclase